MTFFVVEQLPLLEPEKLQVTVGWLGDSPENWLAERVLELCYTNEELAEFAADLGRNHPPFHWSPERRAILQAEIDAAILHLYGLNRSQAEWLLDSFTVLRKYEERDHAEFRTKRLVLEIFDAMAMARQSGGAYQTLLNPGPADPHCCHGTQTAPVRRRVAALVDGAWARPAQAQPGDTGAVLAAVLKAARSPRPAHEIRLASACVLEPRLLVPLLAADKAAEWRRLVGTEADPLANNVAAFAARVNAAWGAAVRSHRGNGRLVEDGQAGTWAPGAGLDAIDTQGWPDGRAGFVLDVLKSIDFGNATSVLPDDVREWVTDAVAA